MHTRLRELTLSLASGSCVGFIDVELPSLEKLHFKLDSDIEVESLISLLNRSGNCLQWLILLVKENLKNLKKLLYRIPSLQKPECEFTSHNGTFVMRDLFQNLSSLPSGLLPKLDSLAFRDYSTGNTFLTSMADHTGNS